MWRNVEKCGMNSELVMIIHKISIRYLNISHRFSMILMEYGPEIQDHQGVVTCRDQGLSKLPAL